MDNITFDVSSQIKHTALNIHEPLYIEENKITLAGSFHNDVFPYALLVIGVLIFIFGLMGIIYLCISWNKYVWSVYKIYSKNKLIILGINRSSNTYKLLTYQQQIYLGTKKRT